jgi:NAD(P)-dependent dehydrogenase (short-subunit alcohol dehydrogenase family)
MELQDKTFIITGGGSGLGAGTARVFVESGARVVLADVNTETANSTAAALGDSARAISCDVCDSAQVEAAIELANTEFGGLQGAVNCAGVPSAMKTVGRDGPHDLEIFRKVLDINLTGTFNVIRLCATAMQENAPDADGERGVFINTASVAAFEGQVGQAAYAASKGGVVAMTLAVARDLARNGMRVVTIAPGLFDTPMMAGLPEEIRESLAAQVPFPPRLGDPSDYGKLARQIVENTMLNGETIRLDGAIRMGPR